MPPTMTIMKNTIETGTPTNRAGREDMDPMKSSHTKPIHNHSSGLRIA